ncbi:MAG: peptidoglycan DD-metalloendopeptidase family protein [Rhodospirillaceae bacterium]
MLLSVAAGFAVLLARVLWVGFFDPTEPVQQQDTVVTSPERIAPLTSLQTQSISDYISSNIDFRLDPDPKTAIVRVKKGQTLASVLLKAGTDRVDAHNAITALRRLFNPRDLQPGTQIIIYQNSSKDPKIGLERIEIPVSAGQTIIVELNADQNFIARKNDRILKTEDINIRGKISSSLYVDATKAGLPAEVMVEVIRLFSWDVDFQRDIHPGDEFNILATKSLLPDGSVVGWGDVKFASLSLQGKLTNLYRFETLKNGVEYFDEYGVSAQKALMKTPIDGARLSSGFGRRKHPILKYTKMHRGIDFAAPTGTPIYAAGNGRVVLAGRNGAYGKYIKIRHNNRYSTAYAHLSRFRRGVRKGKRVRQGQVIGYVGSTGRSTGPHLHYEILVEGRQVNPLRLKLPSGRKLSGTELTQFFKVRDKIKDSISLNMPTQKKPSP